MAIQVIRIAVYSIDGEGAEGFEKVVVGVHSAGSGCAAAIIIVACLTTAGGEFCQCLKGNIFNFGTIVIKMIFDEEINV